MLDFVNPDMRITVENKKTKESEIIKVSNDLEIDPEDINEALIEQPSKYAWYGYLYSNAKYEYEDLKANLLKVESDVDRKIREDAEYSGKKKPAEAAMTKYIHGSDEYIEALEKLNEARKKVDTLSMILKALDQRIDALITLGANARSEQKQYTMDQINK